MTTSTLNKAVKDFNFKDIAVILENTGFLVDPDEFSLSRSHYLGKQDNKFVFAISMYDREHETYYVSNLYIELDSDGKFIGDWSSMPVQDDMSEGEVAMFFEGLEM